MAAFHSSPYWMIKLPVGLAVVTRSKHRFAFIKSCGLLFSNKYVIGTKVGWFTVGFCD